MVPQLQARLPGASGPLAALRPGRPRTLHLPLHPLADACRLVAAPSRRHTALLLSGTPQSGRSFGPYVLGVLALGIIAAPMFNAARGSILIPAHLLPDYGPAWPDAQPWENYLFAILAILIVVINRRSMLYRDTAATEVLLPEEMRSRKPRKINPAGLPPAGQSTELA